MKKTFTLLFFLAICSLCNAQMMHKNWWYMGINQGCNFNTGSPVSVLGGQVNVNEGSIAMSDKVTGALLFYTEGMTVWNSTGAIMTNGTGLLGNPSSTQSGMVVPMPGTPTKYYVFTIWPGNGLRYSIIDMTLSAGLGAVTAVKNVLLGATTTDEKLTGCMHSNGIDYWVAIHMNGTNQFVVYPVTAAGVGAAVVSSVGPVLTGDIGYMNINSCGTKIGLSNYNPAMGVASFNNSTGVVSNWIDLNFGTNYSSGFSPDGTKFYHWSYTPVNEIYEVDLNAGTQAAINASRVLIASTANWAGAFVYGRNGKLYIPSYNTTFMHVINTPNAMGAAVGFVANAVNLAPGTSQLGLPNFIEISTCAVLPIELLYFNGECVNGYSVVKWATASEIRNDHFEIERSLNGKDFEMIAKVQSSSLTKSENKYSFEDKNSINGTAYYRLKQVDTDGKEKYFDIITVNCKRKGEVEIYPNPSSGIFNIRGIEGDNEVIIRDILGHVVSREINVIDLYEFNLNGFENGVYFLEINISGDQKLMKKIILNR